MVEEEEGEDDEDDDENDDSDGKSFSQNALKPLACSGLHWCTWSSV